MTDPTRSKLAGFIRSTTYQIPPPFPMASKSSCLHLGSVRLRGLLARRYFGFFSFFFANIVSLFDISRYISILVSLDSLLLYRK